MKNTKNWRFLQKIFSENTLIGIVILALLAFYFLVTDPDKGFEIAKFLIPLFIIVVCLEPDCLTHFSKA